MSSVGYMQFKHSHKQPPPKVADEEVAARYLCSTRSATLQESI